MAPAPATSDSSELGRHTVSGGEGDVLFREGEEGRDLFILEDGRVELTAAEPSQPVRAGVCEAGDVFGERSCFHGGPREVTARALSTYRAFRLSREALTRIVSEDPTVLWLILGRVSKEMAAPPAVKTSPVVAPHHPAPEPPRPRPPAPQPPRADERPCLVVAPGGTQLALADRPESWVGRRDTASSFAPEIDLTDIDHDRSLSRRHAKIVRRDGRVFVVEIPEARNGTFVNGQRLAKGAEVELADGDRLRFGLVDALFRYLG